MAPKTIRSRDRHLVEDLAGRRAMETYPGQAHFAGSGPAGTTCRECRFWQPPSGLRTYTYFTGSRLLKPCRCLKRPQIKGGEIGGEVPHNAASCKYFEPADAAAPAASDPKRGRF
jgi:hypothetical protein